MKKNEMDGACSMYGEERGHAGFSGGGEDREEKRPFG